MPARPFQRSDPATDRATSHPSKPANGVDAFASRIWQRRPSLVARYSLIFYTALIIAASLFPFVGWRDNGIGAFDYLQADWPQRSLRFDIIINILGYVPLGLLVSLALYPRLRRGWAVLPATLYGAVLSCLLEATQTFLPTRVASKVDLLTNAAGSLGGALLALSLATSVLERGRLRNLYQQWFRPDANFGLVLMFLWFGALAYPEPFALGIGGAIRPLLDAGREWFGDPAFVPWIASDYMLADSGVCLLTLIGAGCLWLNLLRLGAPKKNLVLAFLILTAFMKSIAEGWVAFEESGLGWFSEGAQWGFSIALPVLLILTYLPAKWRARIGFCALIATILLTNFFAVNPYYDSTEHLWAYSRFLNFYGLLQSLSYVWPFLALMHLWRALRSNQR